MSNKLTKQILLEVITPLSIGNANVKSPITDYIIEEETSVIKYINHSEFETQFRTDEKLMTSFLSSVLNVKKKAKRGFLKDFIDKNFDSSDIFLDEINFYGRNDYPKEIHQIVKSGVNLFIPGSSLKGAIKTCVLDHCLRTDNQLLVKLIEKIKKTTSNKEIENLFLEIEKTIFGDVNADIRHDFSLLHISDSELLEQSNIAVYETIREHLFKGNQIISQFREAIKPTVQVILQFKITPSFKNNYLNFLNGNITDLFKIINKTTKFFIEHEIEILQDYKKRFTDEHNIEIADELIDFYSKIQCEIADNSCAYFSIGFGKTFFQNSIGLAIKKKDENTYHKYLDTLHLGKNGQKYFPISRYITYSKPYMPLGWVKITNKASFPEIKSEIVKVPNKKIPETPELIFDNYAGVIKEGENLVARLIEVNKPHSFVEIIVNNKNLKVPMVGLKYNIAITFEIGCLLKVEISSFKDSEIKQVRYKI